MSEGNARNREVRLPPLPPGLEVYRPAEVLGSAVLVVEDEAAMRQQLRIDLHDLGYRPAVASSAPEAMELLARERVAAVLLDLVLDEGEDAGFDLLTWIRHHHPGLPVIVLSAAQVNSAAIRKAYELGASSYFVKGNVPMAHIYSDLAARLVERGTGTAGQLSLRTPRVRSHAPHGQAWRGRGPPDSSANGARALPGSGVEACDRAGPHRSRPVQERRGALDCALGAADAEEAARRSRSADSARTFVRATARGYSLVAVP